MNKKVNFEIINGKKVFHIITEPDITEKRIVIMSHGFRGSSIGPARTFVDFEKVIVENGFSTLRFDQPCSGNSEGDYLDTSFKEWVNTISHFAKKYLDLGYKVALLGQSMGAAATLAATAQEQIKGKIRCILLWVPDPETDTEEFKDEICEEAGQIYKWSFWKEAQDSNFFECLEKYEGGIHLVYGEMDKYVQQKLRSEVIERVRAKNQPVMILNGQDHSPWEFSLAQKVYEQEIDFIKRFIG